MLRYHGVYLSDTRLCPATRSSALADMPPERLYERIRQRPPRIGRTLRLLVMPLMPLAFDALNEEDPLKLFVTAKLEWLSYNLVKVA